LCQGEYLSERPNSYITEFLPVLSLLDTASDENVTTETSTQVKVIGHDNLPPPAFYREREEWCLPESTLPKSTLLSVKQLIFSNCFFLISIHIRRKRFLKSLLKNGTITKRK
jgi:hypothetical protein